MTGTTATWAIPYATGTDRLCDGNEITQSMAERIDTILTAFDVDIAFLNNIPTAKLTMTGASFINYTPSTGPSLGIPWNTLSYDTDHMTDMPSDPTVITYRHRGYYALGGAIEWFQASSAGARYQASVFSTFPVSAVLQQMQRDGGGTMAKSMVGYNSYTDPTPGNGEIDMELQHFGVVSSDPYSVAAESYMFARWYGENF